VVTFSRAPRPLQGVCGRYVEPGQVLCALHTNADSSRVCGIPAGGRISKPPCRSWPVSGRPYCYLHLVPPYGRSLREQSGETLTGRVSENVPPMTQVDTVRASNAAWTKDDAQKALAVRLAEGPGVRASTMTFSRKR
jgi:hypothetical protein